MKGIVRWGSFVVVLELAACQGADESSTSEIAQGQSTSPAASVGEAPGAAIVETSTPDDSDAGAADPGTGPDAGDAMTPVDSGPSGDAGLADTGATADTGTTADAGTTADTGTSCAPSPAGPLMPRSVSQAFVPNGQNWVNLNGALATDLANANTLPLNPSAVTNYLKVSDFGFDIPAGATIRGVIAVVRRSTTSGKFEDSEIKLVSNGFVQTMNMAKIGAWSFAETDVTYGSFNDKWGAALTPERVNAADFGIVISARRNAMAGTDSAMVDSVKVTVHYSCP